ncbi:MAG: DUF721 domain-containing protein [Alphaproteobacteria bacterium]|nr:DUF721 domain-containing protein [Alphaproteobacteria bacterium]
MTPPPSKTFVARRANRNQRLDDVALPLLRQRFGRQLTTAQALRMDWPAIVGAEVASCCQLASLSRSSTSKPAATGAAAAKTTGKGAGKSYAKVLQGGLQGGVLEGVQGGAQAGLNLTLVVEPAFALEIGYQLPQLQQRINGYFGYPAVATIRLKQQPLASIAAAPSQTGQPRRLTRPQPAAPLPLQQSIQGVHSNAGDNLHNLPAPLAEALQSLQYHLHSRFAESSKP